MLTKGYLKIFLATAALWIFLSPQTFSTTYIVPVNFQTIQSAINACVDGDVIIVYEGVYNENIMIFEKNIRLSSTDPSNISITQKTIIDGQKEGYVVYLWGKLNPSCVVEGFTIRNGSTYFDEWGLCHEGGGINASNSYESNPTIQNNVITGNYNQYVFDYNLPGILSSGCGGGISCCNGLIRNNIIISNTADQQGGGIYRGMGTIEDNTIFSNRAAVGGGIFQGESLIQNNLIVGNSAEGFEYSNGGGLNLCEGTIRNNTIYGNYAAAKGGGLASCYGFITNCIIWGNSAATDSQISEYNTPLYCCIQGYLYQEGGNISSIPMFVDVGQGNFRLRDDSPCIDKGNLYYCISGYTLWGSPRDYFRDLDGNCRLWGTSVDMGCYENSSRKDIDGDFLADIYESQYVSNPNNPDTDNDGLLDGVEVLRGTNPTLYETGKGLTVGKGNGFNYSIIQKAIFMAYPLEKITVFMGEYYENIYMVLKDVYLQSQNPTDQATQEKTVIDGSFLQSGFYCSDTVLYIRDRAGIDGFTIRNGKSRYGGGIRGYSGAIQNNIISGNISTMSGGGIEFCSGVTQNNKIQFNSAGSLGGGINLYIGVIKNNLINKNSAENGGGIDLVGDYIGANKVYKSKIEKNIISQNKAFKSGGGIANSYSDIKNNTIYENSASSDGGGISSCGYAVVISNNVIYKNSSGQSGGGASNCRGTILNNLIYKNVSGDRGGGVFDFNGAILNNTIADNTATAYGGGISQCFGLIVSSIIWGNKASADTQVHDSETPIYSCLENFEINECSHNIYDDPRFIYPQGDNYRLYPDSPCIDNGCLYYLVGEEEYHDIEGNCRLNGNNVEIGCYEYGSISDTDGDFLSDIIELATGSDIHNADTDGDSLIDGAEYLRGTSVTKQDISYGMKIGLSNPVHTIQQGIFYSFPNEVMTVDPGLYRENLYFYGNGLTVQSSNPSDDWTKRNTCIDGNRCASVIFKRFGDTSDNLIQGFTIRNGRAHYGGGTLNFRGDLINNYITGNAAIFDGGGIYYGDGRICNNVINKNTANQGGGIYAFQTYLENNTIYGNSATNGGGVYGYNGYFIGNIIWANSAGANTQVIDRKYPEGDYIQDYPLDNPIKYKDPQFVYTWLYDFHLSDISPCIDFGHSSNDACLPPGKGTPIGDMGAYGGANNCNGLIPTPVPTPTPIYTPTPTPIQIIISQTQLQNYLLGKIEFANAEKTAADFNKDGILNIADLVYLLNQ